MGASISDSSRRCERLRHGFIGRHILRKFAKDMEEEGAGEQREGSIELKVNC